MTHSDFFCPWCGLLVTPEDWEELGYFNILIRCPRCNIATNVNSIRIPYDYGRGDTSDFERLGTVCIQEERTVDKARDNNDNLPLVKKV